MNKEQKKRFEEFRGLADKFDSLFMDECDVVGFDPGFLIMDKSGISFTLPKWFMALLLQKLEDKQNDE